MTCTAQRICLKDTSHIETATATITVDETIAPTCTEKGSSNLYSNFFRKLDISAGNNRANYGNGS